MNYWPKNWETERERERERGRQREREKERKNERKNCDREWIRKNSAKWFERFLKIFSSRFAWLMKRWILLLSSSSFHTHSILLSKERERKFSFLEFSLLCIERKEEENIFGSSFDQEIDWGSKFYRLESLSRIFLKAFWPHFFGTRIFLKCSFFLPHRVRK